MDITQHTWFGTLDASNVEAVAQRIQETLTGRRYVFAAYNDGFSPSSNIGFDVDPNRYLVNSTSGPPCVPYITKEGYVGITVCDSYGVFSISGGAYIVFEGNNITIERKAGAGHNLVWKIRVQQ